MNVFCAKAMMNETFWLLAIDFYLKVRLRPTISAGF